MSTVDLHVHIQDGAGRPVQGEVSARLSTVLRDPSGDVVRERDPITARLVSGEATLPGLLTTATEGLTPQGWRWEITTRTAARIDAGAYSDVSERTVMVEMPESASGVVEFADLVPVQAPNVTVTYPTDSDIAALRTEAQEATATAQTASLDADNAVTTADAAEDSVTALSDSRGQPGGIATLNAGGLLTGSQAYVTSVDSQQGAVDLSNSYAGKYVESDVVELQYRVPQTFISTTLNISPGSGGTVYTGAVDDVVSVSVPDPGFDYIAIVWATLFFTLETSGRQRDVPITLDSASGDLVGTASKLTPGDPRYYVVKNCGPVTTGSVLSGAHSFHLSVAAGNGGDLRLYTQSTPKTTGITALILPA